MRTHPSRSFLAILLATVAACHLDKLVEPPPAGVIIATPAVVEASAATGSTAPRDLAVALTGVHDDATHWTATSTGGSSWLVVHDASGSTPDSLHLSFDPAGLAAGRHADTLLITPDDAGAAPTRVPVTFTIGGCHPGTVAVGTTLDDSLRASDCTSAHHPGRTARRYQWTGAAHDSVSLRLTSATLAVDLIVDTAASGDAPPLAESGSCDDLSGACLSYLVLPQNGTYFVEVTTTAGANAGPFTLALSAPHAPGSPDPIEQRRADSLTTVSVGGAVPEPEFVVHATLHDADVTDSLRLEVEVQPVGTDFTGTATSESAVTLPGGGAFVRITGLTDGVAYHWRSRVHDQTGRVTAWQSFGGNPESATDLKVAVAADRLLFRQAPTTTVAGVAITPAIQVAAVDRDGVVVPSFTGTITLALESGPAGATLSGTRSVSAVDGVATFPGLSLDKAGSGYTLLASAAGMIDATSPSFAITPGTATHLAFTQQPTSTTANSTITPAVAVTAYDGYGNVATGFTGAVTVTLGHDGSVLQNAVLSGTRTQNAAAGVAHFADLSIDQLGSGYTLVAAANGVTSATSAGFDIVVLGGTASAQRFSQQPSPTTAGSVISPAVEVTIVDGRGAPVTNYTDPVTLALTGGPPGAILGGTTSRVPSNGVARFTDLSVDRPGTGYQLRASAPSLPDLSSAPFSIDSVPAATGALTVLTQTTGSGLDPDGYTVQVGGESRAIAVNATTTFTGVPAGAQLVTLSGIASNCAVTGDDPRTVTVPANGTSTTTFALDCQSSAPPPARALRFTVQPAPVTLVGGTFGAVVAAVDDQGNIATGYTGSVSLTLSGAVILTSLAGTTTVDAVRGIATFSDLHLTGPCASCQLQAAALSLVGATSNTFSVVVP